MSKHHFRFKGGLWHCSVPSSKNDVLGGHTSSGETPGEAYRQWVKILSDKRRARMERDHWEMRMGIGRYADTRIGLYQHLPKTPVKRGWWRKVDWRGVVCKILAIAACLWVVFLLMILIGAQQYYEQTRYQGKALGEEEAQALFEREAAVRGSALRQRQEVRQSHLAAQPPAGTQS